MGILIRGVPRSRMRVPMMWTIKQTTFAPTMRFRSLKPAYFQMPLYRLKQQKITRQRMV